MNNDAVFKTPSEAPTQSAPIVSAPPDSIVEAPAALRINPNPTLEEVRVNGEPYSNQVMKTETPFDYLPSKTQSDLKAIDKFVDDEISQRGWKHNVTAYQKVIDELGFEMGLEDESIGNRIELIASYAKNMLKLQGIDSVKNKLTRKLKGMRNPKDMEKVILQEIGRLIV